MIITRFCQSENGVVFALKENAMDIIQFIVYQENPEEDRELAFKRSQFAAHLDMLASENSQVTWEELEELEKKIFNTDVRFI